MPSSAPAAIPRREPLSPRAHSHLAVAVLVGAGYFLGAWAGVHGAVMPEGIAILWPPNALLLAALLVLDPSRWWPCFPAVVLAEVAADHGVFNLVESLAFASVNIGESAASAALLRHVTGKRFDFGRFSHVLIFGAIGVVIIPALAALLGAGVYHWSRGAQISFLTFWRVWWFGDALGVLILAPAVWFLAERWQRRAQPLDLRRKFKGLIMVVATAIVAYWAFAVGDPEMERFPVTPFIALPVIAFAGARLGIRVAAWSGVALAAVAVAGTVAGTGPYAGGGEVATVIRLQEYLAVTVFSALALAALVSETRTQQARAMASEEALRTANEVLEQRVRERTAELTVVNRELERLVVSDALTGAFNRRYFMQAVERELQRAQRYARPLSVILWDLDHFKRINDRFGHLMGDALLCAAVHRAQSQLRDTDVLARYGGEEFVVLLPETSLDAALSMAERIRSQLSREPLKTDKGEIPISASFGVAQWTSRDASIHALLERADQSLYQAKNEGRDCVRAAPPADALGTAPADPPPD